MPEQITKYLQEVLKIFQRLTAPQKLLLGLGVGGLVVGSILLPKLQTPQMDDVLYSDLQSEESSQIARKLSELNVSYRLSSDGSKVYVPKSQVDNLRMQLAKEGLPGQDVVGFEKFDGTTLGMSTYVQRIQYVRAVQGELIRSIQKLSAVKRARVHISIPPKKTFLEEEEPPKASVILDLKPGQSPSKNEIAGIAHLVASAVEGLKVNQVTIVDTKGGFLHRPDDVQASGMSSAMVELQRSIENEYEKRVVDLLTPVVGFGKVRAKVAAEMDSSRINTTEETFDPDKAVVRHSIKTEENSNGSKPNPVGIPGSRSNLPGTEPVNPPVPMANTSQEKNTANTTYSIPRKVQVIDKPSGNIKRVTVAVVVDGYYEKANGTESFVPRNEEELKRIQELIANSVGFDNQRRDSITVSCLPFKASEVFTDGADVAQNGAGSISTPQWMQPWWVKALLASCGVSVFALLAWIGIRSLKSSPAPSTDFALGSLPRTVAELEAGQAGGGARGVAGALGTPAALTAKNPPLLQDFDSIDKQQELDLRNKIIERLGKTPKKGVQIVQDWLEEESHLVGQTA